MTSTTQKASKMTAQRAISPVVRKVRHDELDEQAERRTYWERQPPQARIAEVEALRRLWIEITGDPDLPIRVVHQRRLGEPAIKPPR
ncbi:MAG TPA: hypothetical protein VHN14_19345 [Kofleriaceae bacterium]|jgi:hypothetical protein|nr:hypothetical protein [Kofleriaceae bacterium]